MNMYLKKYSKEDIIEYFKKQNWHDIFNETFLNHLANDLEDKSYSITFIADLEYKYANYLSRVLGINPQCSSEMNGISPDIYFRIQHMYEDSEKLKENYQKVLDNFPVLNNADIKIERTKMDYTILSAHDRLLYKKNLIVDAIASLQCLQEVHEYDRKHLSDIDNMYNGLMNSDYTRILKRLYKELCLTEHDMEIFKFFMMYDINIIYDVFPELKSCEDVENKIINNDFIDILKYLINSSKLCGVEVNQRITEYNKERNKNI